MNEYIFIQFLKLAEEFCSPDNCDYAYGNKDYFECLNYDCSLSNFIYWLSEDKKVVSSNNIKPFPLKKGGLK